MTSATITTETAIERAPCRWYRLRSCASLTLRPYTSRMSGACVRLRWRSASGQVLPSRNDMLTAAEAEQLGMALIVAADRARAAEAAVAHDTADRAA